MRASPPPDDERPGPDPVLVVRVVRTGGFAGLRREWTAEPAPGEAPRWIGLIDDCPWDAASSSAAAHGADRFRWRISARCPDAPPRDADLSDADLHGPWRDLVDEVRAFGERPTPTDSGRTGRASS